MKKVNRVSVYLTPKRREKLEAIAREWETSLNGAIDRLILEAKLEDDQN